MAMSRHCFCDSGKYILCTVTTSPNTYKCRLYAFTRMTGISILLIYYLSCLFNSSLCTSHAAIPIWDFKNAFLIIFENEYWPLFKLKQIKCQFSRFIWNKEFLKNKKNKNKKSNQCGHVIISSAIKKINYIVQIMQTFKSQSNVLCKKKK